MGKLTKYLPIFIIGGIAYFLGQRYLFAQDKKDKNTNYFKKLFGDREKQIQQESPEKFMYNIR